MRVWSSEVEQRRSLWRNLERTLDSVKHYASGIVFYNKVKERSNLDEVLKYTKKGEVAEVVVKVG